MVSVQKNLEFSTGLTAAQGIAQHNNRIFVVDEDDDHLYRFDPDEIGTEISNRRDGQPLGFTGYDGISISDNKVFVVANDAGKLFIWDFDPMTDLISNPRPGQALETFGARGISVSDNKVFIVGSNELFIWDFDPMTDLISNPRPGQALGIGSPQAISISDNKVFVVDATTNNLFIWDFDPATNLISNRRPGQALPFAAFGARGISVSDNKVFIVGSNELFIWDFDPMTDLISNPRPGQALGIGQSRGISVVDNKVFVNSQFDLFIYDLNTVYSTADLGVLPIQFARGLDVYMDGDVLKAAVIDTQTDHLWTFDLVDDHLENPTDLFPLDVNGGHGVSRFDNKFWVADDHSNGLHSYEPAPAASLSDMQNALAALPEPLVIGGISFGEGFAWTVRETQLERYNIAANGSLGSPITATNIVVAGTGIATDGNLIFWFGNSTHPIFISGGFINAENNGITNVNVAVDNPNDEFGMALVLHGGFLYAATTERIIVYRALAHDDLPFNREYSLPNNNIRGLAAIGQILLAVTSDGVLSSYQITTSELTLLASTPTGIANPTGMGISPETGRIYITSAAGVVHFDLSLDPVYPKRDIGGFGARNIRALTVSERGAIISDITDDALFVYPFNDDRTGILDGRPVQSTENIVNALGLDSEGDQLYAILNLATRTIVRYMVTDLLFVRKILGDSYNVRGFLGKELSDSYAIRGKVRHEFLDSFLIRGKVRRTFDDMYDIGRQLVIKVLRDSYAIRGKTQKEFADQYPIAAHVRKELADSYIVRNAVRAEISDAYTIRGKIRRTLADSYVIRGKVRRTLDDMYSIGRVVIVKVLADSYAIRGKVRHELSDSFLIRGKVRRFLFDSYSIGRFQRREFADTYPIAGFVRAALADSYVIRGYVRKKLFDMYGIGRFIVIKVFADSYNIRGKVRAEMADQYPIAGRLRRIFQDSYIVRNFVRQVLSDSYGIADSRLGFVFRRAQRGNFPIHRRQRKEFRF